MIDPALQLLQNALMSCAKPCLVAADEHWAGEAGFVLPEHVSFLSNRVDVVNRFGGELSDFDLARNSVPKTSVPIERVFYRIAKEKAQVHHIINQALELLPLGGELSLAGFKNEGLKTYVKKAAAMCGGDIRSEKGAYRAQIFTVTKRKAPEDNLSTDDYNRVRNIAPEGHTPLFSKPGVFGWQKIDAGSRLLLEFLPEKASRVLDLGAGYGYLSVMAAKRLNASFTLTDNNISCAAPARENLAHHQIDGDMVIADCAEGINHSFDVVLCNPPFHAGFHHVADLTERFVVAAADRLSARGCALFVVNQFLPLADIAQRHFKRVQPLAKRDGFAVFRLSE